MLPASYQVPAAIVLLIGGTVSCFFGYRLFRIVLGISGFILGALAASAIFGMSDTAPMVIAAVVGGLLGAAVLMAAYFAGVAIVGAGLGALIANLAFSAADRDPGVFVVVLLSIAGAVGAVYLQRYFIIVGTSFGGAWTLIVGAMALVGDRTALAAAAAGDVWVAYPLNPAPGRTWVKIAWVVLSLIGVGVQMGITGGDKGRVGRRKR
ncbi:MAG: TMEM198/TM7SF3 family protein [Acidobacteria bacterium]|nr:TMEM198/TM7SF3 family protein [Acidobacteriota bacterium]